MGHHHPCLAIILRNISLGKQLSISRERILGIKHTVPQFPDSDSPVRTTEAVVLSLLCGIIRLVANEDVAAWVLIPALSDCDPPAC